jgi:hypothetical protein
MRRHLKENGFGEGGCNVACTVSVEKPERKRLLDRLDVNGR